jgi:hypothetical protein
MEFRTQVLDTIAAKLAALPESHPHHLRLSRMVSDLRREIERDPRLHVSAPDAGDLISW